MTRFTLIAIHFLGLAPFAGCQRAEAEKLHGTWHVLSGSINGVSIPWMDLREAEVIINAKEMAFKNILQERMGIRRHDPSTFFVGRPVRKTITSVEFKAYEATDSPPASYRLDAAAQPKQLDLQFPKEERRAGVFELEGETLKIALAYSGGDRPMDVAAGLNRVFLVLAKKKPDTAARDKFIERAREQLEGTWALESGIYGTAELSDKERERFRLTFAKDLDWDEAGSVESLSVRLDPDVTPAAIDLTPTAGPNKGHTIRGIYRLEKNRLTLRLPEAFSMGRPTSLTENKNYTVDVVLTLTRAQR